MTKLAILGSTGSIGTQTLDVVRWNPERYEVYALVANNSVDKLAEQAREFQPEIVVINNTTHYEELRTALRDLPIKVFTGSDAVDQVVRMAAVDVVVTAMVGYAGLASTLSAIKAGKRIALANKETLVVAGELVTALAIQHKAQIVPVDSEHGAIFQCLVGERSEDVDRLIITASGGPFRNKTIDELRNVKAADALKHPTWQMGAKITIDSASLMNKGFEVMEARWLFGITADRIDVVVHPQSIVHSMVQYVDGSVKAQLGVPDMRLPIQYALSFPERIDSKIKRMDFARQGQLTFEEPDTTRFRNLGLAFDALKCGGNMPCVLNAANEVVVDAFLHDRVGFLEMSDIIEKTMNRVAFISAPTYDDYVECDKETRIITAEYFR
ncbi:MAG: 1-deoxy-D-xylulose-5-phosphate reductoisomerase [Paludibacteraceae bacterium]|nr:1-deoxy-D-xylulose-5-phosphate reductoisomerase [Paludibacteraceae bacterium]